MIILVLAAALTGFLAWVAFQRRSTPGSISFAWMMLAVTEWAFTVAGEFSVVGLPEKIFWSKLQYLGASSLATFFVFFAFEFTRQDQWLTRRNRILLWLIPIATMIMAATNEWHNLVWISFTPGPPGTNTIIYGHGAWFWFAVAYFYLSNLVGAITMVRAVFQFPQIYQRQAASIIVAVLIPWVGSILYITGYSPLPGLDPALFGFAIAGAILAWSLFRYRLLDILPVARDTIVENMSDGVLVLDLHNRVVDINPAAQRLMGLISTAAIGRQVETLFKTWNDIRASSIQQLVDSLKNPQEAVLTILVGKVAPHFIDVQINLILDAHGLYSGRMMILRDLTENHQAQEEIQRLKEFNESIVQSISEGIIIEDLQGRFTFLNPAATNLLGYDAQELLGRHWDSLISKDHYQIVHDANLRRLNGISDRYEVYLVHKNGLHIPVLVSGSPQYDAKTGEITGTLAVFTNLSDYKRAEKELSDTKAMLEAAFEQTPIPMALATIPDQILRIVNTACREFLGIQDEPDYVGRHVANMHKTWQDILPDGQPANPADMPLTRALRGETSRDIELGVIRKDGSRAWELANAAPVFNTSGEQIAALAVFPDITERKRVEQAEREQRILAEALRDTASALNSTLNQDEVLDRILQNIGKVVPHDAANIALIDEHGEPYVVRARGYIDEELNELELSVQMHLANPPDLRHMVETGEPIIISNSPGDGQFIRVPLPARVRSSASAPVLYKGSLIGLLNLDSATPGYFSQMHTDRLRAFADQAAIAIENARLFAETSRRAEQLATLNRIGLATTSGLDMEHVLRALLEQCQQVFDIDVFYLALFDQQAGLISFPLFYDLGEYRTMPPHSIESEVGLTGIVIHSRKTLHLDDLFDPDNHLPNPPIPVSREECHSYIGTPLLLRDEVLGVLSIQNTRPGVYTDEQVNLLETIATQAAIAIENARLFEQMQQLAIIDGLTGLFNRRHFFMQAAIEVERSARYNKQLSVIMMDLDHFKTINDTYGHKAGDSVLQIVAQECALALRKVDIVGRYGGEEFAFILPETSIENARLVAERLRKRISDLEVPSTQGVIKITACLGLASLENSSASIDMLLDCADQALYAAKQGGRNQVRVFRGGLQSDLLFPFGL